MDDYIAKPITLGRLKAMLVRWIHPKAELPLVAADARLSNHEDNVSIDESVGNKLRALGRGDQQIMRDVIGVCQDELPERLRKMHQMLELLEHECGLARSQLDDMRTGRNVT